MVDRNASIMLGSSSGLSEISLRLKKSSSRASSNFSLTPAFLRRRGRSGRGSMTLTATVKAQPCVQHVDRHRVEQAAVDQVAAVQADRLENHLHGDGGAHGLAQAAALEHDLAAVADVGGGGTAAPGPRCAWRRRGRAKRPGSVFPRSSPSCMVATEMPDRHRLEF